MYHSLVVEDLLLLIHVIALSAEYVNPNFAIDNVFIFPIHNAINSGASPYNAIRSAWDVSRVNKLLKPSYAVGLKNSISIGSFVISKWLTASIDSNKYEFQSPNHPSPLNFDALLNKNWTKVLDKVKGFWQRGNYLIIEFNGQGQFKIKRGSQDINTWHDCI